MFGTKTLLKAEDGVSSHGFCIGWISCSLLKHSLCQLKSWEFGIFPFPVSNWFYYQILKYLKGSRDLHSERNINFKSEEKNGNVHLPLES